MDCTLEIQGPPIVQQLARVYASGRSEDIDNKESHFTKKKLPAGTHVFVSKDSVGPHAIM